MNITYDPRADVLAIRLRRARPACGREVAPDLVVELDGQGEVTGWELLNAHKHVEGDPLSIGLKLLAPKIAPAGSASGG